jgi:hypothetical protein
MLLTLMEYRMETYPYGGDYQGLVLKALYNLLKTLGEVSSEGDSMLLVPHSHLRYTVIS